MKSHLKRLTIPKSWDVKRKNNKFIMRPFPGGSEKKLTMPLQVVIRDILKLAKTAREVRFILNNKEILVNGRKRKEVKFPVGLMDVIDVPDLKKAYRVMLDKKGKLTLLDIKAEEAKVKLYKIAGKTTLKKGKVQLNFTDGHNLLVDKDSYKTNDTVTLELGKDKIKDHVKFDKKTTVYLIGGKHVGGLGTVEEIRKNNILFKSKAGVFETPIRYTFAVGMPKPLITIPE